MSISVFLDSSSHLCRMVSTSIGPSVGQAFVKKKNMGNHAIMESGWVSRKIACNIQGERAPKARAERTTEAALTGCAQLLALINCVYIYIYVHNLYKLALGGPRRQLGWPQRKRGGP